MVPEAPLAQTENGLVPAGEGWFVVNARDTRWYQADGVPAFCGFEGDAAFPQLGINLNVLEPGQPLCRYHWEADQEDFLVLSGEALLIVEDEEHPLLQWDFVHCPPRTEHVIVGAGSGPSVILAVGARIDSMDDESWGAYTVSETAARHGASVERETVSAEEAYALRPRRRPTVYRDGWLP